MCSLILYKITFGFIFIPSLFIILLFSIIIFNYLLYLFFFSFLNFLFNFLILFTFFFHLPNNVMAWNMLMYFVDRLYLIQAVISKRSFVSYICLRKIHIKNSVDKNTFFK